MLYILILRLLSQGLCHISYFDPETVSQGSLPYSSYYIYSCDITGVHRTRTRYTALGMLAFTRPSVRMRMYLKLSAKVP